MVNLKSAQEIEAMAEGGRKLSEILKYLTTLARPGATTTEIDRQAEAKIREFGGEPAFKNYRAFGIPTPFPGSVCISINEEIVHGMPYPERQIKEGDVVSIDIGMKYKGYFTDTAYTVLVEGASPEKKKLVQTAQGALDTVLDFLEKNLGKEYIYVGDIGGVVQDYIEGTGLNIVRELVGHGIGKSLHEDPSVPNYQTGRKGQRLEPGLVIAIEPMIYEGRPGVTFEKENWPVYTTQKGAAAHFEHTVAITEEGLRVLT